MCSIYFGNYARDEKDVTANGTFSPPSFCSHDTWSQPPLLSSLSSFIASYSWIRLWPTATVQFLPGPKPASADRDSGSELLLAGLVKLLVKLKSGSQTQNSIYSTSTSKTLEDRCIAHQTSSFPHLHHSLMV